MMTKDLRAALSSEKHFIRGLLLLSEGTEILLCTEHDAVLESLVQRQHITVTVLKQLPVHTGRHTPRRPPEAGTFYLCSDLCTSDSELLLPDLQEVSLLSNMTNSVVGQPRSKATKNI